MKHSSRALALVVLCIVFSGVVAQAATNAKVVLVETFTSATCAPCAFANPVTHNVMADLDEVVAVNIQYHMYWPTPTADPFYSANPAENDIRRAYYGINGIPDLVFDGHNVGSPGVYPLMIEKIRAEQPDIPPVDFSLSATLVGGQMTITADITALESLIGQNTRLRIAVVEPAKHFGTPPGRNGETSFYNTMRKMAPDAAGTPVSLAVGGSMTHVEVVTIDPAWVDVYAIAWLQHDSTKDVLQTVTARPVDYAFNFGEGRTAAIGTWDQLETLETRLANYGKSPDTYDVHIEQSLPNGWSGSVCHEATCFAPFVTDFQVTLGPGQAELIYCDIVPAESIGEGIITLTATSQGDPTNTITRKFRVISPSTPILVMDNDGGADYEHYVTDSLDALGHTYAVWDYALDGRFAGTELNGFEVVVWVIGENLPALKGPDRAQMVTFLNQGGSLFVTGQDLSQDINYGYSTNGGNEAFIKNQLGATYKSPNTNDKSIDGVAGDLLFDGISFSIENLGPGDNGANNQSSPDEIDQFGDGVPCLLYSAGKEAATRLETANYKTLFFAFGFEGISNQTDRDLVMERIMNWFAPTVSAVEGDPVEGTSPDRTRSRLQGELSVQPNPFNPSTQVVFSLAGTERVPVKVDILDLRGRLVQRVFDGVLTGGDHAVPWNGLDRNGRTVASGVYVARIDVDGALQRTKMTLVK